MTVLTLEQIKRKLEDRNLRVVASRANVSHNTLLRIKNMENPNPTYEVIKRLSEYFGKD